MRSSAACSLSLLLALGSAAAGEPAAPEAVPDLPELMRRLASTPGVEAHFRETRELDLLAVPLESSGVLYFVPPDRLARFTLEPAFSALLVEGESVRFREAPEAEEIDLSGSPAARVFVDHFIALWSGDLERLQQLYRAQLGAEGSGWKLVLQPRRAPLDRFVESVVLRGDDRGPGEIVLNDRDGDRTRTVFENARIQRRFAPAELQRLFSEGLPLPVAASDR